MNDNLDKLSNMKKNNNLNSKAIEETKNILKDRTVNRSSRSHGSKTLDPSDAENAIIDYLIEIKLNNEVKEILKHQDQNKEYLRRKKAIYRSKISEYIHSNNINVRGYSNINDFIEEVVGEQVGYSVLEDAFADPDVSDIYCIDYKTIFVEKNGENIKYHKQFKDHEHYKRVIERFVRLDGKEINMGEYKKVDFVMYEDRGTATSPAISTKGYSLTIRKHKEQHIELDQLIRTQLLTEEMASFFKLIIDGESNLAYAGITGSGKTTSLRALLDHFITKNGKRTLVCEDTEELFLKNEHTLSLVTFDSDEKRMAVSLKDIILMALRQKPKYIVVGEIRGEEAMAAVEAMETGHSTLTTMHAGTPLNAINRLINKYLEAMPTLTTDIAERIVCSALDYIVIQDNIEGIGRRITSITEVSYDFKTEKTVLRTIFEYDFEINDFLLRNRLSKEKANHLLRRGQNIETVRAWTNSGNPELERRFITAFNDKYLNDKENRLKRYEKELNNNK